ncbi:MAG TPA: polysaccharide biosynthesis/export family protein [Candidatus Binataceae bacterium]
MICSTTIFRSAIRVSAVLLGMMIAGCGSSAAPNAVTPEQYIAAHHVEGSMSGADTQNNLERLAELWKIRTTGNNSTDYPIGPGDIVGISVPGIEDLKDRTVRVGADGTISLPLLGTIQAGGMTESGLRDRLRDAVGKYMYSPQVDVFVKEYHSRQVAVVGAVKAPGLVQLAGGSQETVLDMLTRAGGTDANAADEIVLLPGVPGATTPDMNIAAPISTSAVHTDSTPGTKPATAEASPVEGDIALLAAKEYSHNSPNAQPIVISLKSTSLTGGGKYMNMPVKPGDVIVVPGGGDVMVTGWVQYPGHFPVGSGLTVLGAIGAAGGPMYAADTAGIRLIRSKRNGEKIIVPINLAQVETGEEPDIPVHANDVLTVPYSDLKIGPYVFYNVLTRVGFGLPVPAF